ncbi:cytochrome b/b6 domain-containing protein [Brevundimonas sp. AJA228-03]|uniref:cytochrome b/b6 domain-containing protein n=1 Tax=Brevundimonas sp. AJA228-03 TaxID=2752515 RepID=UPI001ADECFB3|nr:cytochrome b/b6 domain-containing protein [Brevundimonas sp. AJA228-03]QTN20391.1 cytochrome b/b6 domain-containing protein [Brevundimonas sp. AJA228-03]
MTSTTPQTIRTIKTWDWGVRLFHWLLVAAIAVAFLSSEEGSALSPWHVPAGWVAAILIAFRLLWGFVGGEHARFVNLIRPSRIAGHVRGLFAGRVHASLGHNPLGGIAVIVLLSLVAVTTFTGITGGEDGHEAIAYMLLAMIALHVVAVVAMSFLTRDNLIGAMITGRKKATHFPNARDAAPPARVAVPLAVLVVAGSAYAATRIDPQAFTPGAHAEADEGGEAEDVDED